MKQKAVCLTLALCLLVTLCPISALGVPSQSDFNKAASIKLNKKYNGSISDVNRSQLYKFTLKNSGKIKLSLNIDTAYVRYDDGDTSVGLEARFYENTAKKKEATYCEIGNVKGGTTKSANESMRLIAGSYYLYIGLSEEEEDWFDNYAYPEFSCDFNFKLKSTADKESFKESVNKRNDGIKNARSIKLNKQYRGQFAENDWVDCYKFKLTKNQRLRISFIASDSRMSAIKVAIKKRNGVKVDGGYMVKHNWLPTAWETTLKAGTYYLRIFNDWVDSGLTGDKYMSYYTGYYDFEVSTYGKAPKSTTPLVIRWPKRSWGDGYIVELANNKQFTKNVRTKVVKGRNKERARFYDLPKGKTYYVKARPYKKKKSNIPGWQWMKLKKTIKYKPWSKTLKIKL